MICEEHGSLKRNCIHCENAELHAEVERLQQELEGALERSMKRKYDIELLKEKLNSEETDHDAVLKMLNETKNRLNSAQQQNKQLIEALEEIKDEEWRLAGEFTTIYTTAYRVLQQIQGKEDEA